eukprot:TRINITY_DN8472_c0_g1_i1.p1 TRINITY_DN8472_c0_g1~~TRINITY_DN8472_c0_g1_i1.p1  ORF type:complete len:161 (+),score=45.89 TRINITY_DN8472_c0_g1_i1:30-485(+)
MMRRVFVVVVFALLLQSSFADDHDDHEHFTVCTTCTPNSAATTCSAKVGTANCFEVEDDDCFQIPSVCGGQTLYGLVEHVHSGTQDFERFTSYTDSDCTIGASNTTTIACNACPVLANGGQITMKCSTSPASFTYVSMFALISLVAAALLM